MRYNPEELAIATQTTDNNQSSLLSAISELDDRSKEIVQRRWLSEDKATLHELASEYNVSAERIRQIEKRAMEKMKHQLAV
jgi:RNA polymerase sigma-32 factor